MKILKRALAAVLMILPVAAMAQAPQTTQAGQAAPEYTVERKLPKWGFKTNLLYDATGTINLGLEFKTGRKTSLDIPVNQNGWDMNDKFRKWRHFMVQPEFRLWTRETFDGHFFGLNAQYAKYNVGNLPDPFSDYMKTRRLEGWLAGAGVSYGYRWNFRNPNWAMEATVGVGYAYKDYEVFECGNCGNKLGEKTKHYFGPTKVGLSLFYGFGGGYTKMPVVAPVIIPEPRPVVVYQPVFAASFVTPEVEAVKTRVESGKAYLDFVVGRSEIISSFRNNAAELQKIYSTIDLVKNDKNVTITCIRITGYASPEGTYATNMTLSERRAQSLRNHIRSTYGIAEGLITSNGAGEDWDGLDALVEHSNMIEKYRILEIIRGTGIFDGRERKLMELAVGAPYRQMKVEMFPRLRRSEYAITYTVIPFTIEQGKEVLKTRPGTLSLNEMFLIANTYTAGSEAFNEVFETAVRVFPDSDVANLNAAASALNRKETTSAAKYMAKVKTQDAAYWNNMGLLQWLQGDKAKAAESFAKAGTTGAKNAAELAKHLETVK